VSGVRLHASLSEVCVTDTVTFHEEYILKFTLCVEALVGSVPCLGNAKSDVAGGGSRSRRKRAVGGAHSGVVPALGRACAPPRSRENSRIKHLKQASKHLEYRRAATKPRH